MGPLTNFCGQCTRKLCETCVIHHESHKETIVINVEMAGKLWMTILRGPDLSAAVALCAAPATAQPIRTWNPRPTLSQKRHHLTTNITCGRPERVYPMSREAWLAGVPVAQAVGQ